MNYYITFRLSTLSKSRLVEHRFPNAIHTSPVDNIITTEIGTDTDFDMFVSYLMEQYGEEFPDEKSITDEVKANLILSKYKMGWPKELWMHEKSLSPSPQNLMYGDDDEYIEQQQKIQLLKQQEKERKQRQFEMIQERRKLRLERMSRTKLPENEANLLINTGNFLINFRKKTKWMERTLGINSTAFISDYITSSIKGGDIFNKYENNDDSKYDGYDNDEEEANNTLSRTSVSKGGTLRVRGSTINLQKRRHKNLLRYANKFSTTETEGRAIGDINFSLTNTRLVFSIILCQR